MNEFVLRKQIPPAPDQNTKSIKCLRKIILLSAPSIPFAVIKLIEVKFIRERGLREGVKPFVFEMILLNPD